MNPFDQFDGPAPASVPVVPAPTASASAPGNPFDQFDSPATDPGTIALSMGAPGMTVWDRLLHGVGDVGQGMKQLYLMATHSPDLGPYTQQVNAENAAYAAARAKAGQTGWDVARRVGEAVPALATLPFAPETIAGATALGAGAGALNSLFSFNPAGTWGGKAVQTGIGALTGGAGGAGGALVAKVAAPVVSVVSRGAQSLWNRVTGAATQDAAKSAVVDQIGQDAWNELGAGQQDALVNQAQAALASGRSFDADMAQRANDIQSVTGVPATQGQISRSAPDWYWEQETAKLRGPGDPLQQTFVNQNQALLNAVPSLRQPGFPGSPYEAAENAREAVQAYSQRTQGVVGGMYDAARNAAGAGASVPMQPIADQLGRVVEDYGLENVPPAVVNRLRDYGLLNGTQTRLLTVQDAEGLRRFIGNNINPANRSQTAALRALQNSVDDAVSGVATPAAAEGSAAGAETGAPAAADAFRAARALAAQRFAALSPKPVATLAGTDEAPVNFLQTNVLGAKPGDLAGLKNVLQFQNPAAWNGIRSSVLDWLQTKATSNDPGGLFSGQRFANALDQIGGDRMRVLFSPYELNQLGAIRRASYAITREPPFAYVNHSNSGSTLANLGHVAAMGVGEFAGHVPLIGPALVGLHKLGTDALSAATVGSRAAAAANPGVGAYSTSPVSADAARRLLASILVGPSAGLAGTAGASSIGP